MALGRAHRPNSVMPPDVPKQCQNAKSVANFHENPHIIIISGLVRLTNIYAQTDNWTTCGTGKQVSAVAETVHRMQAYHSHAKCRPPARLQRCEPHLAHARQTVHGRRPY